MLYAAGSSPEFRADAIRLSRYMVGLNFAYIADLSFWQVSNPNGLNLCQFCRFVWSGFFLG